MRIAFDVSRLDGPRTGIHRFICSLVSNASVRCHEWIELRRPPGVRSLPYLIHHLPKMSLDAGADLILSPHAWDTPGSSRIPAVAILHDLWPWIHRDFANTHTYRHAIFRPFPRNLAGIIHGSRFTQSEYQSAWPSPSVPDVVVHHGPDQFFKEIPADLSDPRVPDEPFFLACLSMDARKNLPFLRRLLPALRAPLVVVGRCSAEPPAGTVHLSDCDDGLLRLLYRRATAFIFPSVYEGFGLPPAEAALCDCPALVSDRSSLPEIMGMDYPGIMSLSDVSIWADTANRLIADQELRRKFVEAGRKSMTRYSWEKTVNGIERFCERIAGL